MPEKCAITHSFMKKVHAFWIGSFALVTTSLYAYFQAPPFPVILGGLVALGIMLIKDRLKKK